MKDWPAAASLVFLLAAGSAAGRTWTVGGTASDFPFISPAVSAAADGDTILVRKGVYREDLVLEKTIQLVGQSFPILIGTGEGTVVTVRAAACTIHGFRIEGSGTGQTNRMDAAVALFTGGNRVEDNRIERVFYGVVLEEAAGNLVSNNAIAGLSDLPFGRRGDGIYLYRSTENRIENNTIAGMRDAVYLQSSPRCRVADNRIDDSRYGLHDMYSDDAEIHGNTFRGCSAGANVMNCRRILVERNRFLENRGVSSVGLSLKECDGSVIRDNDIIGNGRGLQVDGSSSDRFTGNNFRFNDTAIQLFSSAEENVFTENELVGNLTSLVLAGSATTSRFADGGRGNRWDDYTGFDFDGDGVGDAPHPLLGAFERLEGANPAVRLYLQSPAAEALDLASRTLPAFRDRVVDPSPLVNRSPRPSSRAASRLGLALGTLLLFGTVTFYRGARSCSKS